MSQLDEATYTFVGSVDAAAISTASDVYSVVAQRRSVRAFQTRPVDKAVVARVLQAAGRAPSGGNLQPWRVYVLAGAPLRALVSRMKGRLAQSAEPDVIEYPIYPAELGSPYRERRQRVGRQLYDAVGVDRRNPDHRRVQTERNFDFFGAPAGLFCYIDRQMGAPQWSDLGMYLQTVMLLLRAEGIDSCPQESWSLYHRTVAEVTAPPSELMLFCGLAIGYADHSHPCNTFVADRAPLHEYAEFLWTD
jgi:nitroreductase